MKMFILVWLCCGLLGFILLRFSFFVARRKAKCHIATISIFWFVVEFLVVFILGPIILPLIRYMHKTKFFDSRIKEQIRRGG